MHVEPAEYLTHTQVTLVGKSASRRATSSGVIVNASIAMDSAAQAANAASTMTAAAINAQLLAVNLPAATLLSAPAVVTGTSPGAAAATQAQTSAAPSPSSTPRISAALHSTRSLNVGIRAVLAALTALVRLQHARHAAASGQGLGNGRA